jgi:NADP-dependent 3-hydroxy acid dehydrogenase YdfG
MTTSDAPRRPLAVVTGASSGIGAATALALADAGYDVVAAARRTDRLEAISSERPAGVITPATVDVTDPQAVSAFAAEVDATSGPAGVAVLVNNAGAAYGVDPIERADPDDWLRMYELNVLSLLRVTQGLLSALERGAGGHVVVMGSIAGHLTYEGGAGYTGAKHGAAAFAETLRLELSGRPVRVTEIAPGMVETEFSVVRLGDQTRADAVYAGVTPLVAEDIADAVTWTVTRPPHVNVDLLVIKPLDQAAPHKVARRAQG